MKVISYDVEQIKQDIIDMHDYNGLVVPEITLEMCLDYIEDWVIDDFGDAYGVTYQDENGEELNV